MVTITRQNIIYLLCDVLATLEVMISIRQDLGLYDRHDAVLQKQNNEDRITGSLVYHHHCTNCAA